MMKIYLFMAGVFFAGLFFSCSRDSNPLTLTEDSQTQPVKNQNNFYQFTLKADKKVQMLRTDSLSFDCDSIAVGYYLKNWREGSIRFSILDPDSEAFIKRLIDFQTNDKGWITSYFFDYLPKYLQIEIRDFTGEFELKVCPQKFFPFREKGIIGRDKNAVYYTSFEIPEDLTPWKGYASLSLFDETFPGGGKHSVMVSGGCVVPHGELQLKNRKEGYYRLQGWAKNLSSGGNIRFFIKNFNQNGRYSIYVADNNWKFYQSADSLYCPEDSTIVVWMFSGGIVPSSMLVDELQVVKIE
ncbi:MAG: hypothetical protein GXO77_11605 [Calditrichaeota bacterium]|nr:hypothetical protein [Calditrichota bacterium]